MMVLTKEIVSKLLDVMYESKSDAKVLWDLQRIVVYSEQRTDVDKGYDYKVILLDISEGESGNCVVNQP